MKLTIAIKCPCETYSRACCACVSMHCDECHDYSKFEQGKYCSNCGRPLKAELSRNYVPKREVIDEILSLIDDKIRYEVEIANSFISARHHKTLYQERINALNDMKLIINNQYRAELKKKYTEVEG